MHPARALIFVAASTLILLACASDPTLGNYATAPPHTRNAFDEISDPFVEPPRYVCRRPDEENCIAPAVVPANDPNQSYFSAANLNALFRREKSAGRNGSGEGEAPYSLGLALAGGGTKASDYSMGVLAALHDPSNAGLAKRVEIISSVSGGSYASLWYYSRLIDHYQIARQNPADARPFDSVFVDCLPGRYESLRDGGRDPDPCPDYESAYKGTGDDLYTFQNHLRGFQDVFSKDFDYDSTQVDSSSSVVSALQQAGLTAVTLPLHWFALGLFDWKPLNLGLSARQYFAGIERTWALRPVNCERLKHYKADGDWKRVCREFTDGLRPAPNRNAGRGYTMTSLAGLYYHEDEFDPDKLRTDAPNIPFWVLNTTAGVSKVAFSFEARSAPDFEDAVFEFTPYAYGSRHFGYWVGTPSGYELHRLAGASAAFLDGQQRTLDKRVLNAAAAGILNVANLNWGVNLDNPRFRDEVRTLHLFLPFPISAFHHRRVNNDGAWIHLSDGGQSDNTGVWSLVRRGVRTIVLSDHAHDEGGDFADVCHLRRNLRRHDLYLRVPELDRLDEVCERGSGGPHYDLWAWSPRIVRGCVTSAKDDSACADGQAHYFAKLLLLKPALDMRVLAEFIRCELAVCPGELARLRTVEGYEDFPTELFGFLVKNRDVRHDGRHLLFPQHSTVWMTLNSSPWLYGAYRELARWQAAGLAREIDRPIEPLSAVVSPVDDR